MPFIVILKNESSDTFFFNIFILNRPHFFDKYTNNCILSYYTCYHKELIILHRKNVNQKIKFKEKERGEVCEDGRVDLACIRGRTYSRKFAGVISNQIY